MEVQKEGATTVYPEVHGRPQRSGADFLRRRQTNTLPVAAATIVAATAHPRHQAAEEIREGATALLEAVFCSIATL